MERVIGKYNEETYALMRIVIGFLFSCHGMQKVLGLFGGAPAEAPPFVIWVGGTIELVCGLMVMVGFLAGSAAFLASGMMAVAYFMAHHRLDAPVPIQNHGELAVVYAWVFLFIATRGSGIWSIDAAMGPQEVRAASRG